MWSATITRSYLHNGLDFVNSLSHSNCPYRDLLLMGMEISSGSNAEVPVTKV